MAPYENGSPVAKEVHEEAVAHPDKADKIKQSTDPGKGSDWKIADNKPHDAYSGNHSGDWYPDGELREFCLGNIVDRSLTVCCQKECGQCGGGGCAQAPGGAKECCHEDIMHGRGENYCANETQKSCVMPLTCKQDQCLPMCPLHPGCSIIWQHRGMDYAEVRQLSVRKLNVYSGAATQHRNMSLDARAIAP
jgi:hypothetical protein